MSSKAISLIPDLFGQAPSPRVVNVASVPQRSPFRYPGGKSWLIPWVRQWLQELPFRPSEFVEPFAGGGSMGLMVAMEGRADCVVMGERDEAIAAVWKVILSGNAEQLIDRILHFRITRDNVVEELARRARGANDLAFQTLLRNRVQHGGIMAPGASLIKKGENGRGIASRWYPKTLARRIHAIASHRERIVFAHVDAFDLIPTHLSNRRAAFFIDPPYTAGGKRAGRRLYLHCEIDHSRLFALMKRAKGAVMLTYDDAPEVRELAKRHGFVVNRVPMSNTHHDTLFELVITNRV
jgi:DNA adenine methylase